ncbi:hypothetical protein ACLKA6_009757 [Drosophila palustris]
MVAILNTDKTGQQPVPVHTPRRGPQPRNGNAALDKETPFRDQPLDLTTGYRHLYPNATPDRPTVAAIGEA